MGEREDGGPAFPKPLDPYPNAQGMESGTHGMTLRDWFAGQALPQVISLMMTGAIGDHQKAGGGPDGFAASAYDIADAMLKARSPSQESSRG